MAYYYGQIALFSFVTSLLICVLYERFILILSTYCYNYIFYLYWIQLINYGILCLFNKVIYNLSSYEISLRACFLGFSFSSGILVYVTASQSWKIFGIYTAVLSTFHLTEFLAIAFTNPATISTDSFIINHSTSYTLAAGISWIEFITESYFFPRTKSNSWIIVIGLIFCAIGEILRKSAIFTAKRNFNHIVQSEKADNHTLVTHGIYNICRHPSYVGWFYWSIGTQLILQNPLCTLIYTFVSWTFFHDRIFVEELSLVKFFGDAYKQYQRKVGTGLPFISGYKDSV